MARAASKVDAKTNRGGKRPGSGRKPGTPNKVTTDVRAAVALLAEGNVGRCQSWLDEVAADDPAKALDAFLKLLEYHIPKLARSDVKMDTGVVVVALSGADMKIATG